MPESIGMSVSRREETLAGRLYWYPKFHRHVIIFGESKLWALILNFNWSFANVSINNFILQQWLFDL